MSTTTTHTFTTAGSYTASDSSLIEVSGGYGILKKRYPDDITFGANYTSDLNGTFGNGTLTATTTGTPTVSSGKVVFNSTESVEYPAASKIAANFTGTIRCFFTPNYSGAPGSNQNIMAVRNPINLNSAILVLQEGAGNLAVYFYDSATNLQVAFGVGFSPVSGTTYEIEVGFSPTAGYLFLDGTLKQSHSTAITYSLGGSHTVMLGSRSSSCNHSIDGFYAWDTIQHTSSYSAIGLYPDIKYSTDEPYLLTNTSVSGNISGFSTVESATGSDAVKYVLQIDGQDKYWTGSAWANSSGYAQSNTAAEINTGVVSDTLNADTSITKVKVYLSSATGSTTPYVDSITLTYDAADTSASTPTACYLEGYLYDFNGPISGQLIEVRPVSGFSNSEIFISHDWQTFDTTSATGYFSGRIWESASSGKEWEFRIGTKKYRFIVPNVSSTKFTDLTITAVTNS